MDGGLKMDGAFPTNIPEQPTLIYLDVDEQGNITNMLRGDYALPDRQYDFFIATYDEKLKTATHDKMKLTFDNSGLVTKVTITVIEEG